MLQIKRNGLADKIKAAFCETEYPTDSIGDSIELYRFKNKEWQDITPAEINTCHFFGFFSKRGLHYFLPAYLTLALRTPDEVSSTVHGALTNLGRLEEMLFRNRGEVFCERFTEEQRSVILEFLRSYQDLFPFPTEGLNPSEKKLTKEAQAKQKAILDIAIDYWENCGS